MHLSRKCSLSSRLKQRKLKVFNCSSISISSQGCYVDIHACTNGERYGKIVLLGEEGRCAVHFMKQGFSDYILRISLPNFRPDAKIDTRFQVHGHKISFIYPTAHSNIYPMMISDQRLACFSKGVTTPSPVSYIFGAISDIYVQL